MNTHSILNKQYIPYCIHVVCLFNGIYSFCLKLFFLKLFTSVLIWTNDILYLLLVVMLTSLIIDSVFLGSQVFSFLDCLFVLMQYFE